MPSHTPGPWEHVYSLGANEIRAEFTTRSSPVRRTIAEVHFYDGTVPTPEEREQMEANAQAIAAVPELIEALKSLTGLFRSLHKNHADWGDYQAAVAALKKAGAL